ARLAALCYGAFGYGYIIPATFLPALAREVITDPLLFGLIWPVFGAAGAISTLCAAAFLPHHSARRLWIRAQWILAAGVIAPVFTINLYVLLFSALCVGGTFMVITMAGIREARRLGGTSASRLIALYTAAFALGQILGPPTVSLFHGGLAAPSVLAAFVLVASSLALGRGASAPETSE
ncbi:YbfB/YjiJ family MFS transporter, partial [Afipia felis]|uniref:YbfB/YjiJ family MFS transporter n=1 Tax=Afipia felis TaxID=1035 RepID=UPI00065FA082